MSTNTLSHVQVIGCRCINSGTCANSETFRLLVSDGQHYMQVRHFHLFFLFVNYVALHPSIFCRSVADLLMKLWPVFIGAVR